MLSLLQNTAVAALFASTALAAGTVKVTNDCKYNIYYTLADSKGSDNTIRTLPYGGTYSEAQDLNGGRSIKIATNKAALPYGSPVLQLEYSVSGGNIFYDISTLNGNPFGTGVSVKTSDGSCQQPGIGSTWQNPNGSGKVVGCEAGTDITLYTCSS